LLKFLSARPVATGAVALGLLGTSVGAGVTILAPPSGSPPSAADFFVATTGSDSNPGTQGSPFLTIDKCTDQTPTVAITCEMAAGTYSASQIIGDTTPTRTATATVRPASGATVNIGPVATLSSQQTWTVDGTANDNVPVNMVVGATSDFTTGTASCAPVSSPCAKITLGQPVIACPDSTRTSNGWTGCSVEACVTGACTFYTGATILSTSNVYIAQDFVHFKDVNLTQWTVNSQAQVPNDVTIENSNTRFFNLDETTGLTVKGGTYGNTTSCFQGAGQAAAITSARPSGVLFDRVTVENVSTDDFGGDLAASCHQTGIKFYPTNGVTIRYSTFKAVAVDPIFIEQLSSRVTANFTFENNFMDVGWGDTNGSSEGGSSRTAGPFHCFWIRDWTSGTYSNIKIRYNSFAASCVGVFVGAGGTYSGSEVKGNIFANASCNGANPPTGWTYSYNVWGDAVGCGTNSVGSVNIVNEYVSEGTIDFHLVGGATSIGKGDPADCPAFDFDGIGRPISTCDAGADER
jgi:hypothetical protein